MNCPDSSSQHWQVGTHALFGYVTTSTIPAPHTATTGNTEDIENPDGKPWRGRPFRSSMQLAFGSLNILIFRYTQRRPDLTFPSHLSANFIPFGVMQLHSGASTNIPTVHRPPNSTLRASFARAKIHWLRPSLSHTFHWEGSEAHFTIVTTSSSSSIHISYLSPPLPSSESSQREHEGRKQQSEPSACLLLNPKGQRCDAKSVGTIAYPSHYELIIWLKNSLK